MDVGDVVRVTGFARERFNLTTLNGSNSNNAPVTAITDCNRTESISPTDVTMPFSGPTAPERYEGMLVRFPQRLVIAEYFNYDQFGELVLGLPLDGETRPFTPTAVEEPGAAANARLTANSLRRITLDDGVSTSNPSTLRHPNGAAFSLTNGFRGGDTVQNTVGVLGFDFSLYRILPTAPADYTAVNPRPTVPEPVGGTLRAAAMNTLNFFITGDYPAGNPLDNKCGPAQQRRVPWTRRRPAGRVQAAAGQAARGGRRCRTPTSSASTRSRTRPGVDPLNDPAGGIVPGVNAIMGAGTYASIDTGTIGTDAIRVGLIYKPGERHAGRALQGADLGR